MNAAMMSKIKARMSHTGEIKGLSESRKERSQEIQQIMDGASVSSVEIQDSETKPIDLGYVIPEILNKATA